MLVNKPKLWRAVFFFYVSAPHQYDSIIIHTVRTALCFLYYLYVYIHMYVLYGSPTAPVDVRPNGRPALRALCAQGFVHMETDVISENSPTPK